MKKQITASVVAFALALAMPAAAFAAESVAADPADVYGTGANTEQTINTTGALDGVTSIAVKGDVINSSNENNYVTVKPYTNSADPMQGVKDGVGDVKTQYEATLAEQVANKDLTQAQADEKAAQWQVNAVKYENLVDKYLKTDNATQIDTFAMHGEVKGGTALVTVKFDGTQTKPGDKVTYVILHEDGSIQYATTTVSANGTIQIGMKSFSAVALINTPAVAVSSEQWIAGVDGSVDGTTAASAKNIENVAAPEKGVSPKTGC